jgi:arginase
MNNVQKSKHIKIFGVPLDLGTEKLGVDMGPRAIRYAGLLDAFEFNDFEYLDYGDLPIQNGFSKHPKDTIRDMSETLCHLVDAALSEGFLPIILGGDHSVSIGSIAGASKNAKELGVLWLDFHPDANTPETSPSGNIHGMTVAISMGYGYPELVNCLGFKPKVKPENICILGVKDIDEGEAALLNRLDVKMFTLFDIDKLGIYKVMEEALKILKHCDAIHLSIDVDVLDPIIAPGTGIVSKGGLSYREALYVMETIGKENKINSIDIIEVNPLLDVKNTTADLVIELLLLCLGGSFGDYERNYLRHQQNNNLDKP